MKEDKRKTFKKRNLEDVKQRLYQAQASGDKFQIKVWTAVLKKLEDEKNSHRT